MALKKGRDPQLNEGRILQALTDPSIDLTPNGIRSLMSVVLMACYDRHVGREFMAEMIDHTAEVGIILSTMEGGAKMRALLGLLKPDVPPTEIDAELQKLCAAWTMKKTLIAEKFTLVTHMATASDTIS